MVKYRIKERRQQLKMTQAELVKKSGISRATISLLENGYDVDIKVSTLHSLAGALRCSVNKLFE